jgi:hypothetical protein
MRKIFIPLAVLLFLHFSSFSQTNYYHNTFWGRIVLSDRISDKLKWELYLQSRTQNDSSDKLNIFKHHQLSSYWFWLHYQASKDLRISLSPFCYFNSISLFPQSADLGNRGVKEYRWAMQIEQTQKLKYFNFSHRYSLEYRFRDLYRAGIFLPNYRVRYRARIEKPVSKAWLKGKALSFILYDEIFLEFGRAVRGSPAVFNQNRLYAGFSYEIMKNVKFNLGYMYVIQERASGKAFDNINVIWGILTFENMFSQFKRIPADTQAIK